jgi:hypothetical protein
MKKILLTLACIILLTCSISSKTNSTYSSDNTVYVEDTTDEHAKYGRCHASCTCYICGRAFGYTKTTTEQTTK